MSDQDPSSNEPLRKRRVRYRGTHPRRFAEKYKELRAESDDQILQHVRGRGNTPAGTHVPILTAEVIAELALKSGDLVMDGTLGWGGHTRSFLESTAPDGRVFGFDVDGDELTRTKSRLGDYGDRFEAVHRSYAGLASFLQQAGMTGFDAVFVDLGVSSMQIDNPARGFSFKHNGPLDMRMDMRRPNTAARILREIPEDELKRQLLELADETDAAAIAAAIVSRRDHTPLQTTAELAALVCEAKGLPPRVKDDGPSAHPAARTFQALRILVNEEFSHLSAFLKDLPWCLKPGGRFAALTFHSGEEKRLRRALEAGLAEGLYSSVRLDPLRAGPLERRANPRAAPARLFSARRA